jgi:uncharacterized protein YbbC (DUF1343 family)
MYTLRSCLKSFFVFFLFSCQSQTTISSNEVSPLYIINTSEQSPIVCGAERTDVYVPTLIGKRVGIVANQTSMVGQIHLVDTLLALGVDVVCVFSPEHGFRGTADAGEKVDSQKDSRTGLPLISLYGKNKKPTGDQLKNVDLILFDIQDVGARFYTYISTLHYVMEAAAENNKQVLVLDRPNPNGHYVDGPVLQSGYTSFVGMHPIPIVHGMTVAEYAQMINGEGWLNGLASCSLSVVLCQNYTHNRRYSLPIAPSPNLRSDAAIALYPSLCLFEGTILSEGRGTDYPFEIFGHPALPNALYEFTFTPKSGPGSKYPKLENQLCNGLKLTSIGEEGLNEIRIDWLLEAYHHMGDESFFITKNRWFDILAGGNTLRTQIEAGKTVSEIRASWQADLAQFLLIRAKYLLYEE